MVLNWIELGRHALHPIVEVHHPLKVGNEFELGGVRLLKLAASALTSVPSSH